MSNVPYSFRRPVPGGGMRLMRPHGDMVGLSHRLGALPRPGPRLTGEGVIVSQRVVSTMTDMCQLHGGGWMLIRCSNPLCKRMRAYEVREVRNYWRQRRWSDRWKDVPQHFYCVICGSRPEHPEWIAQRIDIPAVGAAEACFAPYGIDQRAWALAGAEDRERLIKARR